MNINTTTTISEGGKLVNTNHQTTIKESKMKITSLETHPLGRFIRYGGRDHFRRHSADPST